MLRICIPVHNEATTIGVLLWRLRSVFQGFSREYDVVVYDDASTDGTDEVLEPYQSVMPLTVIRGATHRGYAASIDALVRHVAADDEYARRDAMVLLQGDFTESPEHLPELVKRFEGGADLVAVHRSLSDATPADERRLRRWGRWAVTPFLRLPPVADPFTGFRLVRISVLRELLKALGSKPVCAGDGWAANIDFALNVTPFSRRIENVEFAPRYDVRQRPTRRRGWPDVVALFHWARAARSTTRPSPGGRPAPDAPARTERSERTTEVATAAAVPSRGGRAPERVERDRPERKRPDRGPRPDRPARPPREEQTARQDRPEREDKPAREATPVREQVRPPRPERQPRLESIDMPEPTGAPEPMLPVAVAGVDSERPVIDTSAAPDEKRSRRRRRRSRKDRAQRALDGSGSEALRPEAPNDALRDSDDDAGTSDDGAGEQDDGGDVINVVESGGDVGAETARRKRRSRRRRRGRRPGGAEAADGDGPPGPPAEPPAA